MNAFRGLANVQQATLASVAPGIAEALVATGVGLVITDMPPSSHQVSPFKGFVERTRLVPTVMSSVRRELRQTKGELQFDFSLRGVRHSSLPVAASRASKNESPSKSHCRR